jgi:hypothetical protein
MAWGDPFAYEIKENKFPPSLPMNFTAQKGFIKYRKFSPISIFTRISTLSVKIAQAIESPSSFFGEEISLFNTEQVAFFDEMHWIKLPRKSQIVRTKLLRGESWEFPELTTFVHCIYFHEKIPRLFECRIEKKDRSLWTYATYRPSDDGSLLMLMNFTNHERQDFTMNTGENGILKLRIAPINHFECLSCHTHDEQGPHPCSFSSKEIKTSGPWVQEYIKQIGISPFTKLTENNQPKHN